MVKGTLQFLVGVVFTMQLAGCFYHDEGWHHDHDRDFHQEHHDQDRNNHPEHHDSGIDVNIHS